MVDGMAAASSKASQSASYSEKPLSSTLLTEKQLVKDLPAGVVTLRKLRYWRAMRVGPPWLKVGRVVVYERQCVADWIKRNELDLEREPRSTWKQRQPRRGSR
jgi:hypothetical protein